MDHSKDRTSYMRALAQILTEHTPATQARLDLARPVIARQASQARVDAVVAQVHLSQDREGDFAVRLVLEGPDSWVLNQPLQDVATLFEVVHGTTGLEPPVPMFPLGGPTQYDLADAVHSCVTDWLAPLWGDTEPPLLSDLHD